MHRRLRIRLGEAGLSAVLNHGAAAARLWEVLPLSGRVELRPGEIALALPSALPGQGDRRTELGIGELAYREEEGTLSIFHAATPASVAAEPRTILPVCVLGMLEQEPASLKEVAEGDSFLLERDER